MLSTSKGQGNLKTLTYYFVYHLPPVEQVLRRKDLIPEFKYQIVTEKEAYFELKILMDPKAAEDMIDERERQQLIVIVLDTSFSMKGDAIQLVKESTINFAKEYYEMRNEAKKPVQLIAIPFNERASIIQSDTYFGFESQIKNLEAEGKTSFAKPFELILQKVRDQEIKDLNYKQQ